MDKCLRFDIIETYSELVDLIPVVFTSSIQESRSDGRGAVRELARLIEVEDLKKNIGWKRSFGNKVSSCYERPGPGVQLQVLKLKMQPL